MHIVVCKGKRHVVFRQTNSVNYCFFANLISTGAVQKHRCHSEICLFIIENSSRSKHVCKLFEACNPMCIHELVHSNAQVFAKREKQRIVLLFTFKVNSVFCVTFCDKIFHIKADAKDSVGISCTAEIQRTIGILLRCSLLISLRI